jgi:hypothetical protein
VDAGRRRVEAHAMKVLQILQFNKRIWICVWMFLMGFNAGRANWIGVAMFVISIPVFVWWTRKYTKLLLRRSA